MGSKSPRPSAFLDKVFSLLLPPAARDAVLGDLWERYRSPGQFLWDGMQILPFVIASQIRRNSNLALLGLQAFVLFACLGGLRSVNAAIQAEVWIRAGIPCVVALLVLLLRDIYRVTELPTVARAAGDALVAGIAVVFTEALLTGLQQANMFPDKWVMQSYQFILGAVGLPVLCILRVGAGTGPARLRSALAGHADGLVDDYSQFHRRVMWRNRAEMAALVGTILGSGYFLWRFNPSIALFGWSFLAGYLCLLCYLAIRGAAKTVDRGIELESLRVIYRRELSRQDGLRRIMWWFWFVPLFAGLITGVIGGITRQEWPQIVLGCLEFLALAYFIAKLNSDRRRQVEQKIGTLAAHSG